MNVSEPYTLLLVDDDAAVLASLKRQLRKEPFVVESAPNAAEAIALLESSQPMIVMSDHKMPERDGVSLLTEIKNRWPSVVRIMISGFTDMDILVGAINEAEIFRFIPKPWEKDHLIGILMEAAAKYGENIS